MNKITKLSKANYYSEFFEENKKKNFKKNGKELKNLSILRKTPKKIQNISNNVKFITNHKNIANTIKSFLVDIPKQVDNNIVKTHKKYQDYLLSPVINTFRLDPTTTEEVQSYINTLEIIKTLFLRS